MFFMYLGNLISVMHMVYMIDELHQFFVQTRQYPTIVTLGRHRRHGPCAAPTCLRVGH